MRNAVLSRVVPRRDRARRGHATGLSPNARALRRGTRDARAGAFPVRAAHPLPPPRPRSTANTSHHRSTASLDKRTQRRRECPSDRHRRAACRARAVATCAGVVLPVPRRERREPSEGAPPGEAAGGGAREEKARKDADGGAPPAADAPAAAEASKPSKPAWGVPSAAAPTAPVAGATPVTWPTLGDAKDPNNKTPEPPPGAPAGAEADADDGKSSASRANGEGGKKKSKKKRDVLPGENTVGRGETLGGESAPSDAVSGGADGLAGGGNGGNGKKKGEPGARRGGRGERAAAAGGGAGRPGRRRPVSLRAERAAGRVPTRVRHPRVFSPKNPWAGRRGAAAEAAEAAAAPTPPSRATRRRRSTPRRGTTCRAARWRLRFSTRRARWARCFRRAAARARVPAWVWAAACRVGFPARLASPGRSRFWPRCGSRWSTTSPWRTW